VSRLKICPQCGTEYELDQRFCPKDGTTLRTQGGTNDLVGSIVADRYHVLRKLGEGGMGQVYLAEHVKMGRKSAVKVMNPGMMHDADAISRFNREAANASRISHPNVAAVYDFGETGNGLIYLAMEFVDGPPLTQLIEQQGSLPPLRAADIARQVAEALAVAHDMGIVHRDLKPDNIMVTKNRDGTDLVKVVDFGIAKAANSEAQKVTKTGFVVGTPEYMSPEQLAGDPLDGRSDIYTLALVTFNMLTGTLPFPSESAQETMIMRLTDKPKRLSDMKPGTTWTPEVQAVMDRALERDAARRYQSASEFGRELYRAVAAMPQSAAAAAGTQVIDAAGAAQPAGRVPSTRVSGASEQRTAALAPPPTPSGKSKVPLIAAIATVVVLGGGTAAVKMMQRPPAAANPNAAPAVTTPATGDSATDNRGGRQSPKGASDPQAKRGSTSTPPNTVPVNGPTVDVNARLARIRPLTDAEGTADQALRQLAQLDSQARATMTADQLARSELYRSYAFIAKNDMGSACRTAKHAYTVVSDSALKVVIAAIASNCN
jgi:eukaryotic-like serine/threonine-protein kinase